MYNFWNIQKTVLKVTIKVWSNKLKLKFELLADEDKISLKSLQSMGKKKSKIYGQRVYGNC